MAMGVNGDVCFSGSRDSNIRVWKVPPSDTDPYENYGETLDTITLHLSLFLLLSLPSSLTHAQIQKNIVVSYKVIQMLSGT